MSEPWPYNLPIFRRSHRATSPDDRLIAEIDPTVEVSMSNPTIGALTLSSGLHLKSCNPSFLWSDDSRYLAVPRYFMRWGLFRRQRLFIIDVHAQRVLASPETAAYFMPESFENGILIAIKEPFHTAVRVKWRISEDLASFRSLEVTWAKADQTDG